MRLFVDDRRDFPKAGYQCCRDAESAKLLLSIMKFESVTLDYNLGSDSENGLDILIWMKENSILVPSINVHSNHVIGRELMRKYAEENFPQSNVTMNMLD